MRALREHSYRNALQLARALDGAAVQVHAEPCVPVVTRGGVRVPLCFRMQNQVSFASTPFDRLKFLEAKRTLASSQILARQSSNSTLSPSATSHAPFGPNADCERAAIGREQTQEISVPEINSE